MFTEDDAKIKELLRGISRIVPIEPFSGPDYKDREFLFIAATPRSGSSYLSSLLTFNGYQVQGESFRIVGGALKKYVSSRKISNYERYIRSKIEDVTKNAYCIVKCVWHQFCPVYFSGAYQHYFRGAKFIYLTRRDVLAQAISLFVAMETGYFHSINENKKATIDQEVSFDYEKIRAYIRQLAEMQSDWEQFFASEGITPLRISYEEVERRPADVVKMIGEFIGKPIVTEVVTETNLKVVRTNRNEILRNAYIAAHRELVAQLSLHPSPNPTNMQSSAGVAQLRSMLD